MVLFLIISLQTIDDSFASNVTDLPFVPFIEVDENDNLVVSSGRKLYKLTPNGDIHPDFSQSTPRVTVHPNPTKSLLYIDQQYHSPERARILNVLGKEVAQAELVDGAIDVSGLLPAPYVLLINEGNQRIGHVRFVKE